MWPDGGFYRSLQTRQCHILYQNCRRINAAPECQIIGRCHMHEHIAQITSNGHFADRELYFAIFNPKARSATAIVTGHAIDPHANQLGDIKASANIFQHIGNTAGASRHI